MKSWLPLALVATAAAAMLVHGPIPQLARYHEFADTRTLLAVPNAASVLSNAAFALVGLWGFLALRERGGALVRDPALRGYSIFLAALILTAMGSSFYHLAPDNARLVWDRMPIALACAGLLAAVHAETHGPPPQPSWIPIALGVAAIASVTWWSFTEARGGGDLRPYLLLQGAPLFLIPLWQQGSAPPLFLGAACVLPSRSRQSGKRSPAAGRFPAEM